MQDLLKGSCSVLAGTIVGALLGTGTFLTVEVASKYITQNSKINHVLSMLECVAAPLPLSKDGQELRRQLCEGSRNSKLLLKAKNQSPCKDYAICTMKD